MGVIFIAVFLLALYIGSLIFFSYKESQDAKKKQQKESDTEIEQSFSVTEGKRIVIEVDNEQISVKIYHED